ncbi:hypothetical protein PT276_00460 [Orbaceae bacterium ESL0721]|nr:hypothetical protein [Orbaceae bacterium ESL0721]
MIGSDLPEKEETIGLTIPKPLPREGYDIIFPDRDWYGGIWNRGAFYYVNQKRQVVYRYDADRYLELQGENCEGLIWYHDDANNIHTRIEGAFFTAYKFPKFKYYNPGRNYIAIPTQDLTSIMFSVDGGKSFIKGTVPSYSAVSGDEIDRFIGVDDEPIQVDAKDWVRQRKVTTVPGNTGYFILNNGDVIFGETAHIYNEDYHSQKQEFRIYSVSDEYIIFGGGVSGLYDKNPAFIERVEKAKTIQIEPYQGWDRLRCVVGAEKVKDEK